MNKHVRNFSGDTYIGLTYVTVLNMSAATERMETFQRAMQNVGMMARRTEAVDGSSLTLPMPDVVDPNTYRRCHGRELRLGEVGCYLSHLKAMRAFLATPYRYAVIFEDDATVSPDIVPIMDELVGHDLHGFDVVRFDYRRPGMGFDDVTLGTGHAIRVNFTRCTGSCGYMINRRAAKRYLKKLLPMVVPFDHAFDRPLHLGLKIGNVNPPLVVPNKLPSQIESGTGKKARTDKVGPLGKISVLAWRAGTEIGRALYATRELIRSVIG